MEPLGNIVAVHSYPHSTGRGTAKDKVSSFEEVVVVGEAVHNIPEDILAMIAVRGKFHHSYFTMLVICKLLKSSFRFLTESFHFDFPSVAAI